MTREEWAAARAIRIRQYERFGPIAPLPRGPAWLIPETSWQPDEQLAAEIREVHSSLVLIHDPLTHLRNESPALGIHLYNRNETTGIITLEVSSQFEMEAGWPKGRPRAPGRWLLRWLKEHMKAQFPGDASHIDEQLIRERMESNELASARRKAGENETVDAAAEQIAFETNRILA